MARAQRRTQHQELTPFTSTVLSSGVVVCQQRALLKLVHMNNGNGAGSTRILQLFDATAIPGAGAVPNHYFIVYGEVTGTVQPPITLPNEGWEFTNGIVLVCSSSIRTYAAAAEGWFAALYRTL